MAPGRSFKALVSRRRRTKGDDEDDDESVAMADDSQSEASSITDLDDDAEASDLDDTDTTEPMFHDAAANTPATDGPEGSSRPKRRRKPKKHDATAGRQRDPTDKASAFVATADTNMMMMNGLSGTAVDESVVDFDNDAAATPVAQGPTTSAIDSPFESQLEAGRGSAGAERRRREQHEYKKKRDSDPTYIPNRGNFFMHDARTPNQRGFSAPGRGRGRGRGIASGSFAPPSYVLVQTRPIYLRSDADHPSSQAPPAESAADSNWKHDLHATLDEPVASSRRYDPAPAAAPNAGRDMRRTTAAAQQRPLNFSKTTQIGRVQIRVLLPGMKAPVLFSDVPVKSHTRLPDHRPPLRRDKPVRISMPDAPPRYRFPSSDRSFIFIPRALRPNQQGFGRARGSFGGYGAPASRRTSMYGGSVYSPSVLSMSRRSSLAREVPRESAFSPTGSYTGRPQPQLSRPVVRLPHTASHRSSNPSPAGSAAAYNRSHPYPLPQTPAVEHWAEPGTMHQPRPQKTISVTGIESPAGMSLHAPQQQDQQPFHNQLPLHIAENQAGQQVGGTVDAPPQPPHSQQYMYHGGLTIGTPLSNIPERAIHAQPFEPGPAMYSQFPASAYYYPGQAPQYASVPGYGAPLHAGFGVAESMNAGGMGHPVDMNQAQFPMVAYETNGMVYYQDASQVPQYPQQDGFYPAGAGGGEMMAPTPEGAYYYPQVPSGPVYYSQA